mgnify:CR=1 FL=1
MSKYFLKHALQGFLVASVLGLACACAAHQRPQRSMRACSTESQSGAVTVAEAIESDAPLVAGYVVRIAPPCPPCPPESSCDPCEGPYVMIADSPDDTAVTLRLDGFWDVVFGQRYVFRTDGAFHDRIALACFTDAADDPG